MLSSPITKLTASFQQGAVPSRSYIQKHLSDQVKSLDLGCGLNKLESSFGVDSSKYCSPDLVHDVDNLPLPLEDNTFDLVYADQFLEHLDNIPFVLSEVHRVLKNGGLLIARVPYFRSSYACIDPTHKRFFTIGTMDYFVAGTDLSIRYPLTSCKYSHIYKYLSSPLDHSKLFRALGSALKRKALRSPHHYENTALSSLFPFTAITYVLVK